MAYTRVLAVALFAAPAVIVFGAHGCNGSDEPPIEDYCTWLARADTNCFQAYGEDVLQLNGTGRNSVPRCTNLSLVPTPDAAKIQTGSFQVRDKLEKCFLNDGGIVGFDPPIDLAALPIVADVAISLVNADETECATVTWADVDRFTLNFVGDVAVPPETAITEDQVAGGTFFMQRKVGRKTAAVGCPSGESHYFDLLQIGKCPEYTNVQPRAELVVIPGGLKADGTAAGPNDDPLLTKYGQVSLSVSYQPIGDNVSGLASTPVTYFKCVIPPPPERCADGIQNGDETDVDCGGTSMVGMSGQCDRCEDGAKCIIDGDCVSKDCEIKMGVSKCGVTPDTSSSSSSSSNSSTGSMMMPCGVDSMNCATCMTGVGNGGWTMGACAPFPAMCTNDANCNTAFATFKACMCNAQEQGDTTAQQGCKDVFKLSGANGTAYMDCIDTFCGGPLGAASGCNF